MACAVVVQGCACACVRRPWCRFRCSGLGVKVHGFSVCDSPELFYKELDEIIFPGMFPEGAERPLARDLIDIEDCAGLG